MKRTPLAALAVCLALACAACSDDDPQPDFAPPESTSPAPTDTGTTSEPPEQALSPEETVRAWVEARNVTVRTGRAQDVYALSTKSCKSCQNSVEPIRQAYEEGGHMETSGWRLVSVKREPTFSATRQVAAAVIFAAGRTFPSADADPISYNREKHILLFRLAEDGEGWKVNHFAYLS